MTKIANNGFNLEERTARLGEEIIKLARKIPADVVNKPIIGIQR